MDKSGHINSFFGILAKFPIFLPKVGIQITKCVGQFLPILTIRRRGGPMCPRSGNILRCPLMFGEFVMPSAPAALIVAPDHVSSMGNPAKAQIL